MNAKALRTAAVAAAAALALGAPSFGFRMIQNTAIGRVTAGTPVTCSASGGFAHWNDSSISWYLNTAGQGAGKAAALKGAMNTWTNVEDADYTLTYEGTTTAGWATDGRNTFLWTVGHGCDFESGCIALTALVLQSGQVIVESDIMFNTDFTWNTDGADYDTRAVAAHELGHSLGIHHTQLTTTPRPTMYAQYFGTGGRTLHSDDVAALQCAQDRYPPGPSGPPGAPPTPASMTASPNFCHAQAMLSWSSSTGATFYEVQRSGSSTFTSPILIYSGPNTSLFFLGSGITIPQWYRVRACNADACSGYRAAPNPVDYYPVCL